MDGPDVTVGPELTGAWVRAGLQVDGSVVADPASVLWLQTPSWYADIRVPVARPAGAAAPGRPGEAGVADPGVADPGVGDSSVVGEPGVADPGVADPGVGDTGMGDSSVGGRFGRPWAFAGRAEWRPPVMTWHHLLDSDPTPEPDSNPLTLEGDLVVETGTVVWGERVVPFVEEWRRISGPLDPMAADVAPGSMCVTVGGWRIEVTDDRPAGEFRAVRSEIRDGAWCEIGRIVTPCLTSR